MGYRLHLLKTCHLHTNKFDTGAINGMTESFVPFRAEVFSSESTCTAAARWHWKNLYLLCCFMSKWLLLSHQLFDLTLSYSIFLAVLFCQECWDLLLKTATTINIKYCRNLWRRHEYQYTEWILTRCHLCPQSRKLDVYFEYEEKLMSKSTLDKSLLDIISDPDGTNTHTHTNFSR